ISFAVLRCPPRVAASIGGALGTIGWLLLRRRRRVTLENLERAFGREISSAELRRIARGSFRHFGRLLIEGLTLSRFSPRVGGLMRLSGVEHIRAAYARGAGVILFSAHFGNWEAVALMQGWMGLPLTLVTRPLDNPLLERHLARLRSLSGN